MYFPRGVFKSFPNTYVHVFVFLLTEGPRSGTIYAPPPLTRVTYARPPLTRAMYMLGWPTPNNELCTHRGGGKNCCLWMCVFDVYFKQEHVFFINKYLHCCVKGMFGFTITGVWGVIYIQDDEFVP